MAAAKLRPRPVVLVVLDGHVAAEGAAEPDPRGLRPTLTALWHRHLHGWIDRHAGTSRAEAGYRTLGAGRPVTTAAAQVDAAIRSGVLASNDVIRSIVARAKGFGGRLHLIGLLSDGGIHGSRDHLVALIDVAKAARVRVVVHALLDGRDVPAGTAPAFLAELEVALAGGVGRIGTVAGRSWGMESEGRWDRISKAYRAILATDMPRADSALAGVEQSYELGHADESVEPFVVFDYPGVSPVDAALHFNVTAEGARGLTRALVAPHFEPFARKGGRAPFAGRYAGLTTIDPALDVPSAFPNEVLGSTLAEIVARAGLKQLRCADAESRAYATNFFGGGREEPFAGEDRAIGPSSVRAAEEAIRAGMHALVLVQLGNPERNARATAPGEPSKSIAAADEDLGRIAAATADVAGAMVVTSAVGPAPCVYATDADRAARVRDGGALPDVAATLLELLDLPLPPEMAGRSLLAR
jgi:2,3-bisphosphoglycerate-independent phosphoglycerate mutase